MGFISYNRFDIDFQSWTELRLALAAILINSNDFAADLFHIKVDKC